MFHFLTNYLHIMAFKYTVTERKSLTKNGTRQRMQVARQVNLGKITLSQLAREIADITSLGRGDVSSVLTHLSEIAIRYAKMGYSVKLGDLGTLTPRLSAKAIPTTDKYTTDLIRRVNVRYTPSLEMKEQLRGVTYERFDPSEQAGTCPAPGPEPSKPSKEPDHSTL